MLTLHFSNFKTCSFYKCHQYTPLTKYSPSITPNPMSQIEKLYPQKNLTKMNTKYIIGNPRYPLQLHVKATHTQLCVLTTERKSRRNDKNVGVLVRQVSVGLKNARQKDTKLRSIQICTSDKYRSVQNTDLGKNK